MGAVVSSASMSLDGFNALADDSPGPPFDWYGTGTVEVRTTRDDLTFHLSPQSAAYWRAWTEERGVPVVVVTRRAPDHWSHAGPSTEFAGDVAAAVARGHQTGGATVGVAAGTIVSQCLDLGPLDDEVAVDQVPVVLGAGTSPTGPGPRCCRSR